MKWLGAGLSDLSQANHDTRVVGGRAGFAMSRTCRWRGVMFGPRESGAGGLVGSRPGIPPGIVGCSAPSPAIAPGPRFGMGVFTAEDTLGAEAGGAGMGGSCPAGCPVGCVAEGCTPVGIGSANASSFAMLASMRERTLEGSTCSEARACVTPQ